MMVVAHPTPTLRTARLLLRPLTLADAVPAQALFAHWEVVRLLNGAVPWPYPEDGVLTYYRDVALPGVERGEEWHWAICLPGTEDRAEIFIGAIGVMLTTSTNPNNRGFWIGLPYQGQGFATEACEAVTRFWFEVLEQPSLTVPKASANMASRKISERMGMRLVRTEPHRFVSGELDADIWEQTREEWLRRSVA